MPEETYCLHCGTAAPLDAHGDWLCPACERYQDQARCPTCGSITRRSALPENMQPKAAKPKKEAD